MFQVQNWPASVYCCKWDSTLCVCVCVGGGGGRVQSRPASDYCCKMRQYVVCVGGGECRVDQHRTIAANETVLVCVCVCGGGGRGRTSAELTSIGLLLQMRQYVVCVCVGGGGGGGDWTSAELTSIGVLLQMRQYVVSLPSLHRPSKTLALALNFLLKLISHGSKYKNVFRDVGVLIMLISALKAYAADMKTSCEDLG